MPCKVSAGALSSAGRGPNDRASHVRFRRGPSAKRARRFTEKMRKFSESAVACRRVRAPFRGPTSRRSASVYDSSISMRSARVAQASAVKALLGAKGPSGRGPKNETPPTQESTACDEIVLRSVSSAVQRATRFSTRRRGRGAPSVRSRGPATRHRSKRVAAIGSRGRSSGRARRTESSCRDLRRDPDRR